MKGEAFPLDSVELNTFDCVKWSKDNHICVVTKQLVTIYTPPFQHVEGCSLRRSKVDVQEPVVGAEWSAVPVDGHHRLAVLTDDGRVRVFGPRMDPAWNTWRQERVLDVDAACFAWSGADIVYGARAGAVHDCDGGIVRQQRGDCVPVRICCPDGAMVVAWDDGTVESTAEEHTDSVGSDIWGAGPMLSLALFARTNKLFIDGACRELPTMSPITGLTERYCCTADGHLFDNATLEPLDLHLGLHLDSAFGLAEIPCRGVYAVVGESKGAPVLAIFADRHQPATVNFRIDNQSTLCERWLHLQHHPTEARFAPPESGDVDPTVATRCVFCGSLQADGRVDCRQCGAYCFRVMEK